MQYIQSLFILFVFCLGLTIVSCGDDEGMNQEPSSERNIISFTLEGLDPPQTGIIDDSKGTVKVEVPYGTDLTALVPTIEVSEGALVEPASGVAQDFSSYVTYKVIAENGATKVYTVVVAWGESNNANLDAIHLSSLFRSTTKISDAEPNVFELPYGTDLTSVIVEFDAEEADARFSPESGTAIDLTNPVTITVTAPDGSTTKEYTIAANILPDAPGIRGVWLTNVDSNVLSSLSGINDAVNRCADLNINTIFVVTWNKAETTYPSQVVEDLIGKRIGSAYEGRDPLRELIDAAHAKGIKVFAWFEYGFAAYNGSPGPLLETKPEWAAVNNQGQQVVKNGFYWMNSLLPEVQKFMTSLVLEVVQNYPDIDGVQGDDRLPAMPVEGGYDDYTVERYKDEHGGSAPPDDFREGNWVQWRADILSQYGKELYDTVKYTNPNCLVAMSPSPMTFGLREYLQDFPEWVNGGYSDIVSPQLYRRDSDGLGVYRGLLTDQLNRIDPEYQHTFQPGLLSHLGGYVPEKTHMMDMIIENRKHGVTGEVHFFYNALIANEEVFRVMYPVPATFPEF